MDAENKLKEWGFECLVEKFKENDIDMDVFCNMSESMIKELIPQVGLRYKFTKKFKEFQCATLIFDLESEVQNIEENFAGSASTSSNTSTITLYNLDVDNNSTSSPSTPSSTQTEKSEGTNFKQHYPFYGNVGFPLQEQYELYQTLSDDPRGREIIQSYKTLKKVTRSTLAEVIVDRQLKDNPDTRIKCEKFKELAKEIALTFPGELPESYYIPYHKTLDGRVCTAKGILWDKYINKRRILKRIGLIPKSNSQPASPVTPIQITEDDTQAEDFTKWLHHNIMPWTTVMEYWTKTFTIRNETFTEINTYFNTYPALKQPGGYSLLEIDFEKKYPNETGRLISKWPHVSACLIKLAESKNENTTVRNFLSTHDYKAFSENQKEIFALLLLPLLIPPSPVKSKRSGTRYKPSKIEIQQAFCCIIDDMSILQETLEGRRQKLLKINETLQPSVVVVGKVEDIIASYVIIDNIHFKLETPLRAIDIGFKSFHALSAKYPCEAEHVWLFLQKYMFNISTEFDKSFVSLNTFISDLNNIDDSV